MTKDWVEAKIKEANDNIADVDAEIRSALMSCGLLDEEDIQIIMDDANKLINLGLSSLLGHIPRELFDKFQDKYKDKSILLDNYFKIEEFLKTLPFDKKAKLSYGHYKRYLDSDPIKFDGDIIITDPCYVLKEDGRRDDWSLCECGERMDKLGFTPSSYMTRDTLYGDWSCTTYDLNTKEEIGGFCADAGLVSVFLLEDILRYNPEYKDHLEKSWCATHIKNFKGTVQFVVKEVTGEYENDTEWWKKGDKWTDYQVKVVGHGVNKITGEPIDFVGTQTGL